MITNNAINNNSLTLIQNQTATASSALTFTSGITTNNINYLILSNNLTTTAGTGAYLLGQISIDGGSTYISIGYLDESSNPITGLQVVSQGLGDATITMSSYCILFNLGTASGLVSSINNSMGWSSTNLEANQGSCVYPVASTLVNALQLVMDDGSAFSGTFSLYSFA